MQPYVSKYEYNQIMDTCEYDPESEEWTLPSMFFKDLEPDVLLRFSSRYAVHEYVYNYLAKRD